jgi:predicted RNA-binding protein YlxR (DUF448 family)
MICTGPLNKNRQTNTEGENEPMPQHNKRSRSAYIKKISREQLDTAVKDYLTNGGKITKITEEDVLLRRQENLAALKYDESHEFLNGDFQWK